MTFTPGTMEGLWRIVLEPRHDARGWFARTFCEAEFGAHGLNLRWPQANTTRTRVRGSIRGLHWQAEPHPEIKVVRCSRGAVWDVVVDVRPQSPTCGRWEAFELSEENGVQLYIPAGFAHGFQTLTDDAELNYLMSESYRPELARGVRWDDPDLRVSWPLPDPILSDRDRALPRLSEWINGGEG
jgi:dTDP-4-dehydrorhamnose 3,5-epimerase